MWIGFVFCFIYICLITVYLQGWKAISTVIFSESYAPKTPLTILIPARNEADKIEGCLKSILKGNYPPHLLKIIVLDDFSEDKTVEIVQQFSENLVPKNSGSPSLSCIKLSDYLPAEARFSPNKKKAIELGVAHAKGEIIVTTDADCIVSKDWLLYISAAFENPLTQMICAPVAFHQEKNMLQRFQSLDFLGLMGITAAGYQLGWHQMANGANLAYRKQVFESVGGYTGNEHLASGDDMFLVQKVAKRWPGSVSFLKSLEATVLTEAAPDWKVFWQQRLRWGTKNAALQSWPLRLSLLAVFLFSWSIWVNLGLAIVYTVVGISSNNLWILLFQIMIKALFDYIFLAEMCQFFNRKDLLRWFWPSFFLHMAYIPLVGTASIFFKKYEWKGRNTH